jgi:hypothetical protein
MSNMHSQLEEAVLETLVPDLEAEGYQVLVHPQRAALPEFMRAYQPDAIAVKRDKKIAIEVKTSAAPHTERRIQQIREIFTAHPEWEFRLVYAPPRSPELRLPKPSRDIVLENAKRIPEILDESGPLAALLTGWSVLEAAARFLMPTEMAKPQTPARLLETLASTGYLTPEEADNLRPLGRLRNEAAHGRLDVPANQSQIEQLAHVVQKMLEVPPRRAA